MRPFDDEEYRLNALGNPASEDTDDDANAAEEDGEGDTVHNDGM